MWLRTEVFGKKNIDIANGKAYTCQLAKIKKSCPVSEV